jgi:hypothetical protein
MTVSLENNKWDKKIYYQLGNNKWDIINLDQKRRRYIL